MEPRISREQVNNLPIRRYEGEICLIGSQAELEQAMLAIGRESVVGFDTETRPAFRKGEVHLPCLVQIATNRAVYLFPLLRMNLAEPLARLLANPAVVKAGVAMADDLRQLKLVFPFEEAGVVDVGVLAKRQGLKQSGVRNLAAMLLGFRIPKGASTSNWASPRLSPAQITYAATDAWACRELFLYFQALESS